MQGSQHFQNEYPLYLPQETDTATPRTPIPIYYFHTQERPFCQNQQCVCQRGKQAGAALYPHLIRGTLLLAQVNTAAEIVPIAPGTPDDCQMYGHAWEITDHPDIKECQACHISGYCPGCTPTPTIHAQPFLCTYHARRQGEL